MSFHFLSTNKLVLCKFTISLVTFIIIICPFFFHESIIIINDVFYFSGHIQINCCVYAAIKIFVNLLML